MKRGVVTRAPAGKRATIRETLPCRPVDGRAMTDRPAAA